MDTIANECNVIENVGNNQTDSEKNASAVGENILKAAFPQIIGFSIEAYTISSSEVKLVGCSVRCSEKQMLKSPVKLLI